MEITCCSAPGSYEQQLQPTPRPLGVNAVLWSEACDPSRMDPLKPLCSIQNTGTEVYTSQSKVELQSVGKVWPHKAIKSHVFQKYLLIHNQVLFGKGKDTAWNVKENKQRVSGGPFFLEEPVV